MSTSRVLVIGATGYVGGRLIPALLHAGHDVRAAARSADTLVERPWGDQIERWPLDATDQLALREACDGVDRVVHLVHSMEGGDFAARDREIAEGLANAAAEAGVRRIVYLGGLGEGDDLSPHLASRQEVGRILRAGPVPTTEVRAAVVLGSGSASFEMLRGLTEVLPVMVTPRWVNRTQVQPIAIADLVEDLVDLLDERFDEGSRIVDVGGPDVVTYADMIRTYASLAGLRRFIAPVPVLTPSLSSRWVGLTTPLPPALAGELVRSLAHDVVVRPDHDVDRILPRRRVGLRGAIERAMAPEDPALSTRWSDVDLRRRPGRAAPWDPDWSGARAYVDERTFRVDAAPEVVFSSLQTIGGDRRWLVANALWSLRGVIDQFAGGVGLRRGRRHPTHLRTGDVIDWWRVRELDPPRRLLLEAEMLMPGRGWLAWDLVEEDDGTRIEQTATFVPQGVWGRAYWYALLPFHGVIFPRLVRRVAMDAVAGNVGDDAVEAVS